MEIDPNRSPAIEQYEEVKIGEAGRSLKVAGKTAVMVSL